MIMTHHLPASHVLVIVLFLNKIQANESRLPWVSADLGKIICDQKLSSGGSPDAILPAKDKESPGPCGWFERRGCGKLHACKAAFKFHSCEKLKGHHVSVDNAANKSKGAKKRRGGTRIVGGSEAPPHKYRSIALMKVEGRHACSGSILNSEWILSAAHCIVTTEPGKYAFVLGDHNQDREEGTEQAVTATKIIVHENYSKETQLNDIVLFKVEPRISFNDNVFPAALAPRNYHVEGMIWVAGWGLMKEGGLYTSSVLQEVSLPVVPMQACKKVFSRYAIEKTQLCAGSEQGGMDACQGDSGGPMYSYKDGTLIQVGIVSWGEGCARAGLPGVYTRVSEYLDWIKKNVPDVKLAKRNPGSSVSTTSKAIVKDEPPTGQDSASQQKSVDDYGFGDTIGGVILDLRSS